MSEQTSGRTPNIPQSIDFVFEMGLEKIRDQIGIWEGLDTKTGVILGFVVVSVAEIVGFLILAASDGLSARDFSSKLFLALVSCGLLAAGLATVFGVIGLRIRVGAMGFRYDEVVREANRDVKELKLLFLDDIRKSIRMNTRILRQKQAWAKRATYLAVAGIMCYMFASLVFLGRVILTC